MREGWTRPSHWWALPANGMRSRSRPVSASPAPWWPRASSSPPPRRSCVRPVGAGAPTRSSIGLLRRPLRGCVADRVRDRARLRHARAARVRADALPRPAAARAAAWSLPASRSAACGRGSAARTAGTRCRTSRARWFSLGPVWVLAAARAGGAAHARLGLDLRARARRPGRRRHRRRTGPGPPRERHAAGVADALVLPRRRGPLPRRARARAAGRRRAGHAHGSRPARMAAPRLLPGAQGALHARRSSCTTPTAAP